MGQLLKKKRTKTGSIEAEYDTDIGDGAYYLYYADDLLDADLIGVFKTREELFVAFAKET